MLDDDYDSWRKERYQKFSDDFIQWRSTRTSGSSGQQQPGQQNQKGAGSQSASSTASGGNQGNTGKSKDRTELIVLITPRVITSSSQARQVTDDYRQQMQLLRPAQ